MLKAVVALALSCVLLPMRVHAQMVSIALLSDDRYRGESLSREQAVVQAGLSHDWSNDIYAGAVLAVPVSGSDAGHGSRVLAYAGRSWALARNWRWELGATRAWYNNGYGDDYGHDYTQAYAGIYTDTSSVRLYYAQHYMAAGSATYAEFETSLPLSERLRWLVHAGILHANERPPHSTSDSEDDPTRIDLRSGLGMRLGRYDAQVNWTYCTDQRLRRSPTAESCAGWVLGLSRRW